MFVANCECDVAPNPSCCSDPSVLCERCAREALNRRAKSASVHIENVPSQKPTHVPLGIPVFNYRREQKPTEKRQAVVQNQRTDGKPTPLGIPVIRY